jgi:hypothetical protein
MSSYRAWGVIFQNSPYATEIEIAGGSSRRRVDKTDNHVIAIFVSYSRGLSGCAIAVEGVADA